MTVRVKLYGTLRRLSNSSTPGVWQGEILPGERINELLDRIGAGKHEANAAMMNGQSCQLDAVILEGAELVIVTPMGGGSRSIW